MEKEKEQNKQTIHCPTGQAPKIVVGGGGKEKPGRLKCKELTVSGCTTLKERGKTSRRNHRGRDKGTWDVATLTKGRTVIKGRLSKEKCAPDFAFIICNRRGGGGGGGGVGGGGGWGGGGGGGVGGGGGGGVIVRRIVLFLQRESLSWEDRRMGGKILLGSNCTCDTNRERKGKPVRPFSGK